MTIVLEHATTVAELPQDNISVEFVGSDRTWHVEKLSFESGRITIESPTHSCMPAHGACRGEYVDVNVVQNAVEDTICSRIRVGTYRYKGHGLRAGADQVGSWDPIAGTDGSTTMASMTEGLESPRNESASSARSPLDTHAECTRLSSG